MLSRRFVSLTNKKNLDSTKLKNYRYFDIVFELTITDFTRVNLLFGVSLQENSDKQNDRTERDSQQGRPESNTESTDW